MIYYIGLLTIALELIILTLYIRMISRVQQENIVLENNIHQAELYYLQLKNRSDNIRKFRHDLKKHIRIVEQFLAQNQKWEELDEYHQLQDYMEKMKDELTYEEHYTNCDDELINAICKVMDDMCTDKNISFSADIAVKSKDLKGMDPYHLTGIIMNLLDNAYEACSRSNAPACPSIRLEICRKADGVSIAVGNSVSNDFDMNFETSKSDKEIHGIGLGIARDYSAIYGGNLEFSYNEDHHYLTIKTLLEASA